MDFKDFVKCAQTYFPDLNIKYKDQSKFMKFLGIILFFNKDFLKEYITTIGDTIYYPNEDSTRNRFISNSVVLLHELVHIYDNKRFSILYSLLYLFPQILTILFIPLLFISWKIALIGLIFLLPLPAYFRMYFEKRGYLCSLYVVNFIYKKYGFCPPLEKYSNDYIKNFKNSAYYYMWYFNDIDKIFKDAVQKIKDNKRPYDDPVFDMIDSLLDKIK